MVRDKKVIDIVTKIATEQKLSKLSVKQIIDILLDNRYTRIGSRFSLAGQLSTDNRWYVEEVSKGTSLWSIRPTIVSPSNADIEKVSG